MTVNNLVEKLGVPMEECCKFFCYNPIRKYSDPNKKGTQFRGKKKTEGLMFL